jgi:FlaA1/EpsC-like NDP-sugar epimerase
MSLLTITVMVITPLIFRRAGLYARFWRYASIDELLLLAGAWSMTVVVAGLMSWLTHRLLMDEWIVPRSIPLILLLVGLVAIAGPRLAMRVLARRQPPLPAGQVLKPVAIMGAGDAGAMILRELQQNPQVGQRAVAFLDDDPSKRGMVIHGLRVIGGRGLIPQLAQDGVKQIIIAMPTAAGKQIREIMALCTAAGIQARILPGVYELLGGRVTINHLRNVEIDDLLRRAPVQTDIAAVRELLKGKRVLITGGGGSIGGELARQVAMCDPREIILLGHGENSIFEIVEELRRRAQMPPVRGVVADVRFPDRIRHVFASEQPQIVFHAAAHKHVPLMEENPGEAILNNVLGTQTVLDAAKACGVERLVLISTDKAVHPTNIMGATKRVAELLLHQAAVTTGRPWVAVRFGNVLGSRGSVLHTFRRQIAAGGPVTVTDPEVQRYFMTIPEAVQLVLQASVMGRGGEVFVLDMGEPVRIVDLAADLIRLSGLELGRDIDITFTGMRPGEKRFEELFLDGEAYRRTEHLQIFTAANGHAFVPDALDWALPKLYAAARADRAAEIIHWLQRLVPEYQPPDAGAVRPVHENGVASDVAGLSNGKGH